VDMDKFLRCILHRLCFCVWLPYGSQLPIKLVQVALARCLCQLLNVSGGCLCRLAPRTYQVIFAKTISAFWARCLLSCNAQFPLGDSAISLKAILPPPDVSAGLPKPPLDVSADSFCASDVWFAETSARCLC